MIQKGFSFDMGAIQRAYGCGNDVPINLYIIRGDNKEVTLQEADLGQRIIDSSDTIPSLGFLHAPDAFILSKHGGTLESLCTFEGLAPQRSSGIQPIFSIYILQDGCLRISFEKLEGGVPCGIYLGPPFGNEEAKGLRIQVRGPKTQRYH